MVVPTLDGGERFRRCLAALADQRPVIDALVVVDSGSADGTARAAVAAGARVLSLEPGGFDHGLSRNQGAAALPEVDVVIFLVQDALPQGDGCLEQLARAALEAGVGAATARQVPPSEASPLTRATLERSPLAAGERRRIGPLAAQVLDGLDARALRGVLLLDDVACAVRGSLFRRGGFPATEFGEDALLAYDLLHAGWALLHEPRAVVSHGHEYDRATAAARYEQDARFLRERFGLRVRPTLAAALKGWLAQMLADHRWALAHPSERSLGLLLDAANLRLGQCLGQWRGSRGPLGRRPEPRAFPAPVEVTA